VRCERLSEEEETYSTIFTALRHTIRRRILRMLATEPMTFTDMLNQLGIESPHLTYHLESLGVLLAKTDRGQYRLSAFGQAAVSMMGWVEDAPKTEPTSTTLTAKWKAVFIVLIVGIAVLSSICYQQYGRLDELDRTIEGVTSAHARAIADLLELFTSVFTLDNGTITHQFTANGTVERGSSTGPWWGMSYETLPIPYNFFNIIPNTTLEVTLNLPLLPPNAAIPLQLLRYNTLHPSQAVNNFIQLPEDQIHTCYTTLFMTNASASSTYSILLPTRGWYVLFVHAPTDSGDIRIPYTISFKVLLDEGGDVAFIVLPRIIIGT